MFDNLNFYLPYYNITQYNFSLLIIITSEKKRWPGLDDPRWAGAGPHILIHGYIRKNAVDYEACKWDDPDYEAFPEFYRILRPLFRPYAWNFGDALLRDNLISENEYYWFLMYVLYILRSLPPELLVDFVALGKDFYYNLFRSCFILWRRDVDIRTANQIIIRYFFQYRATLPIRQSIKFVCMFTVAGLGFVMFGLLFDGIIEFEAWHEFGKQVYELLTMDPNTQHAGGFIHQPRDWEAFSWDSVESIS